MEDIHIINLFLERSEDAIRQVEVKYEKFCFKIAWNILYNTEDSEECVNDTWLITWNKIPPKTPTKLSAFLGKITRNLALDNFRKKNASKRADTHMMDICGEVEKLENTIKDYVEEDIKKKEILNILEKFLSDLKAGDRDIFVRRYWYKSKKQRIFAFRGKEYNSFTECCLAYGLNPKIVRSAAYRTKSSLPETLEKNVSHMEGCVPQESTGNDENSGNKVISKKRHRAKEPFFYDGEKYVSLGQCCEIYGINETSVRARAWRIHCTWEEAVKHFIEKSNADELKKIFVYKGKEYQSVAECCRKYDVRAASVRNRASSTGCSIEEALDHFIKKKIVTKKNEFVFRNKSYETLEECCEVYGVNANSVSSRKYRLGCSTDESLEHFIANKEIIEERIQKFTFKGMEYPSLRACCKKYGIEDACVRQRARDKNCSIEESFEHFMTRKRKKMLDNPEFDYHGTLYPSLKECCEQLKISKNSVVSKSRRSGCSLQEAVEYYVKKQHNK